MVNNSDKTLIISGQVVSNETRQGKPDLRLEAWDNGLIHNQPLVEATTDTEGHFEIPLDLNQLVAIFGKRPPELFFKVYQDDELLASTENSVVWNIKKPRQEIIIEINEPSLVTQAVPPQDGYHIAGRVIDQSSRQGVTGLRVEAWDNDPGTDDFLGQATTDEEGRFTITFTEADFNRRLQGALAFPSFARLFEDRQPDLYFKIYDGETLLLSTRDSVRVNLSAHETDVTLEIDAPPDKLAPPDFATAEVPTVEPELLPEWLTEIEPLPPVQEPLTATPVEKIELPDGVELIPIEQIPEPVAAPTLITRSIAGQIHHQKTRQPLANFTIFTAELVTAPAVTDAQGHFTLSYTVPEAEADQERPVQLTIANPDGQAVHQLEVTLAAADELLTIAVPLPLPPTTPDTTVDELVAQLQLELPDTLRRQLAEQNITTLANLLQARHQPTESEFAIAANGHTPLLQRLEAHANLSLLPTDTETDAALINQGYDSIIGIAQTPRETFVAATAGEIGSEQAGQIYQVAQAQTAFLNNVITGLRISAANNPATAQDCPDCQTAVSPLAYLADLLDYGLKHIRHNGTSINLDFLENNFHQLFGDLPTDCEAVDRQVRQVRLVVEVLRSYLRAHPPATSDALATAEQRYRETAYRTLLTKIATSYEAVQEARLASEEERQALANALGITPDHLGDLLLRSPSNRTDTGLTEQNLERIFGLADTTRDPLSEGATLGPDQGKIEHWDLDGVAWRQNTDSNGRVYGQIEDGRLKLYQDPDRTDLVAEGPAIANQDNVISLINNSGLSARINLNSNDNGLFELVAVPEYLSWRLEHLYQLWIALDWPPEDPFVTDTGHPIIDPDRVGLIDLLGKDAPLGSAPQVVLRNRRSLPGLQALYTFHEGSGDIVNDTSQVSDTPLNLIIADPTTVQWETGAGLTVTAHNLLSTLEPVPRIINACQESQAVTLELWIKPAILGQFGPARLMALANTPDHSNVMLGQGLWGRQPTDLYSARQHTTGTNFSDLAWPLPPRTPIEAELTHLVYTCTAPTQDSNGNPVPGRMTLYVNGAERTSVEFKGDFSHWDDSLHLVLANERTGTRPWLGTFYLAAVYSQALSPNEIKRNYLADCYSAGECARGVALWQVRRPWLERWQLDLNPATDVELIPKPEAKTNLPEIHDPSPAVQLWRGRQRLLSNWQEEFKADPTVEKFEVVLEALLGVPLPMDEALAEAVTGLELDPDCLSQLSQLVDWIGAGPLPPPTCNDPTLPPDGAVPDLTEVKWAELYAQLKKLAELPQWVTEEREQRLYLDDAYFFVALDRPDLNTCLASIVNDREAWETQLRRPPTRPLVDPDVITEEHLRPNRNPAAVLWTERDSQLRNTYTQIDSQRQDLDERLIDIYVFDTILAEDLFANIFSEFRTKLSDLYQLDALADYEILLEQTLACPIPILEALQGQLVAGEPARSQAIEYITTNLLLTVEQFEQLMTYRTSLKDGSPSSPPDAYTVLARRVLVAYLMQLARRKLAAGDPALIALGFNPEMLARLAELRGLLLGIHNLPDQQDVLLEEDWADVYHILIQAASKQRYFNAWRKAEREHDIILSPLYFELPDPLALITHETEEPSIWRAHWRLRRDWEDTLKGRLDQWNTAITALQEAVTATEKATLPLLRATLLRAVGPTEVEAADWVTKNLLIDAQASPCQMTTRIIQAIETMQGLIWSARGGLLVLAKPLGLDLDRQTFDEDWRWLGSYATWRAAMLVFLYPENLLLPTLRREQTLVFKKLVSELKNDRRLSPEEACQIIQQYEDYFRNICTLVVKTCIVVEVSSTSLGCLDTYVPPTTTPTVFLFGITAYKRSIYWSKGEPNGNLVNNQTFWDQVPGLTNVIQLIGVAEYIYEAEGQERQILLLFARTEKDTKQLLQYTRFDLRSGEWNSEPTELDLPDDVVEFTARLVPNRARTEPPGLIISAIRPEVKDFRRDIAPNGEGWGSEDFDFSEVRYGTWDDLPRVNGLQISTEATTRMVAVGDFDGDELHEVVFTSDQRILVKKFVKNAPSSSGENGEWIEICNYAFNVTLERPWGNEYNDPSQYKLSDFGGIENNNEKLIQITPLSAKTISREIIDVVSGRFYASDGINPMGIGVTLFIRTEISFDLITEFPNPIDNSQTLQNTYKDARLERGDYAFHALIFKPDLANPQMIIPVLLDAESISPNSIQFIPPDYPINSGPNKGFIPWYQRLKKFNDLDRTRPANKFSVVGDFDGDEIDEVAIALDSNEKFGPVGNEFMVLHFVADPNQPDNSIIRGVWQNWGTIAENPRDVSTDVGSSSFAREAVSGKFSDSSEQQIVIARQDEASHGNDYWARSFEKDVTSFEKSSWKRFSSEKSQSNAYDVDFSTSKIPTKFTVAGNFNDDGHDEILALEGDIPYLDDFKLKFHQGSGFRSLYYDSTEEDYYWRDMLTGKRSFDSARSECRRGTEYTHKFAVVADIDGDDKDEVIFNIDGTPDFWVMKYHKTEGESKNIGVWKHVEPIQRLNQDNGAEFKLKNSPGKALFAWSGRFRLFSKDEDFKQEQLMIAVENSSEFWFVEYNNRPTTGLSCEFEDVKPNFDGPYQIGIQIDLDTQKTGWDNNLRHRTYFEEAWYHIPIQVALELQKLQQHQNALDWYRLIYDYSQPTDQRENYYGLTNESRSNSYSRGNEWLRDLLNPHGIATARHRSYTRFTLLSIIRCLLEYADVEFTKDTVETVPHARNLYLTALSLLETLKALSDSATLPPIMISGETGPSLPTELDETPLPAPPATLGDYLAQPAVVRVSAQVTLLSQASLLGTLPQIVPALSGQAGATAQLWIATSRSYDNFCIPRNPVLNELELYAYLNLFKIRNCMNIAGLERQLEPYAATTDIASGLSALGTGRQLVLPGTITIQPTPYRYSTLIEWAKQLVQLAMQVEGAMLAALEKRDAEFYARLQARQGIELARANVRLQESRVKEAESGIRLAELQQQRAQIQVDQYEEWLDEGLLGVEQTAIGFLVSAAALYTAAAATGIIGGFSLSNPFGGISSGASALAQAASTTAQILQIYASQERREQEWRFQKRLAQQDVRIGQQQVTIAKQQVQVVGQEREIAQTQSEHAKEISDFLINKFTNAELYDWMSGTLEGVYSFFLQQATAMAKLAENQLAFERQTVPQTIIQSDYWEVPTDTALPSFTFNTGNNEQAVDRRGLTGSARLLQDIYRLDGYAFDTNERKLQLTKTISLAALSPAEFERFRTSGELNFRTTLDQFDQDFAGHYLRLIRQVRVSVFALIPPNQGIRATLENTGPSQAVLQGGTNFQTITMQRLPQRVALIATQNATGLFELDPQAELKLPFEGVGVATSWRFNLPPFSNPFDFQSIADVLLTIDYTALYDSQYEQQIHQTRGRSISADRPFSLRYQFADQWFDLHNPDQTATPLRIRFDITRSDFPPNLDFLKAQQLVLHFARRNGVSFPEDGLTVELAFKPANRDDFIRTQPLLLSPDGTLSTRRGNANNWLKLLGQSPVGAWELVLPDKPEVRAIFNQEEIEDILFVITYSGETP